ncbi:MAG: quinol:electron acceptor oxidoreductase subunit ActD [Planctomycetota bacterium]|nr:quinol:electron acceptor oxidoreductase subunit ActD [Planctomycetota bacterium]
MAETNETNETTGEPEEEFLGLLARFEDPDALVEGCDQARRAGYTKMDAFSPFPVHGIDDAIGIQRTKLPVLVFCVGMTACGLGLFLQWYTNTFHHDCVFPGYDFLISGKAMFSLPANIPVTFEVIVLLSAFTAFFGMWALNGLPKLSNPLFRNPEFRRSTSDGFFLYIEKEDGSFSQSGTRDELMEWGAEAVDPISAPEEELQVPGYFKLVGLIVASLLLVPPVVIFRAQFTKNPLPRMHVNPDMDRQHRSESQDASPAMGDGTLFADDRAMRIDPVGTIARGELGLVTDVEFHDGVKKGTPTRSAMAERTVEKTVEAGRPLLVSRRQDDAAADESKPAADDSAKVDPELDWLVDYPEQIRKKLETEEAGLALYARGKRQFDVYCSVCHGYAGYGDGLVSKRALALNLQQKAEWIAAKSLHDPQVIKQPVGRIFDTISNGRGGMGPYRSQITAEDRWAIIFFVRALQATRDGEKSDVPEDARVVAWDQVNPLQDEAAAGSDAGKEDDKKEDDSKPE